MVMHVCYGSPARALVPQFHAHDQSVLLERFESPVHRRRIDRGTTRQNLHANLLGAPVVMFLAQDLEHGNTSTGRMKSVLPQGVPERHDSVSYVRGPFSFPV